MSLYILCTLGIEITMEGGLNVGHAPSRVSADLDSAPGIVLTPPDHHISPELGR